MLVAMRYVGQGYDVEAPVDEALLASCDRAAIRDTFENAYRAQFGRVEPSMAVEIVSWRVTVSGPRPEIELAAARPVSDAADALKGKREVYFGPEIGFVEAAVYDRYALVPGDTFDGPCIFEERESTTVVPPDARATIDPTLNLMVDLPKRV
jgi:N-methylhydantoinase A